MRLVLPVCAADALVAPSAPRRLPVRRGALPLGGELAKNGLITTWLFGGMVPALIGINGFALAKLRAPARYDGFVAAARDDGSRLPLASLGAADAVFAEDAADALDALAGAGAAEYVPLSVAIGAAEPTAVAPRGPGYLSRAAFKRLARARNRAAPDACLDGLFDVWARGSGAAPEAAVGASLASWRRADGGWDAGAVDRAVLAGRSAVLLGFAGLVVLDGAVLAGLALAARGGLELADSLGGGGF